MIEVNINLEKDSVQFEVGGVVAYHSAESKETVISMIVLENNFVINRSSYIGKYRLLNLKTGCLASYSFDSLEEMYDALSSTSILSNISDKLIKYISPCNLTLHETY